MGRGSYLGGATIISPKKKRKKKRSLAQGQLTAPKKTPEEKEAEIQEKIRFAAERLAKTQAEFEAETLKPSQKGRKTTGPSLGRKVKKR